MSGSPSATLTEIDLSSRVPSFPGAFGGISFPAKKGPLVPTLVTSDTQLLNIFTPDGTVEVGFDLGYFSSLAFLQKSDKLWVTRVIKDGLFAGLSIKSETATTNNQSLPAGLVDPTAFLFDSNPDTPSAAEITDILCTEETTAAVAEISRYTTVADVSASLDATFFILSDDIGTVGFWFDVNDSGTTIPAGASAAARNIEITGVTTNMTAAQVAAVVQAAIDADSKFSATALGADVTVTDATAEARTDGNAGDTGFTFLALTQGANAFSNLDGNFFQLFDAAGSVAFWIDVDNSGTTIPAGATAADRAVEIQTITTGMTANQVAAEVQAAVAGDAAFSATVATATVTATSATQEALTDGSAETSGFTITVTQQGVTEIDLVDEVMLIFAANAGDWANDVLIKITNFATNEELVQEPDAFLIEVFKSANLATPEESFICSRVEGAKDGFGQNIFIEDVLLGSNFIRASSNAAVVGTVKPKDQLTPLAMAGGDDGLAPTDAEFITSVDQFSNPDDIFITILMDAGNATPAYGAKLDSIAQSRQDSVALLSVPFADEASASFISDIVDYRKNELNLNSSYSALYTPHVKVFDQFNNRELFVSPEGYAGAVISATANALEIWFPPAGFRRGLIQVLDVRRRFTKGQMDQLYNNGINPIRFTPGKGIAIFGQKTLLSRPSALDRLNVRLVLIVIEPAIKAALEDFLFEFNDLATRSLAKAKLDSFLANIQSRRGLLEFLVVIDSSNNDDADEDALRMNVDVFARPNKAVEFVPTRVVVTSSGLSFEQAQELI